MIKTNPPKKSKSRFKQGHFEPVNPSKYQGTQPIYYRSSWEKRFMVWCDTNPSILIWASESLVIPYHSPVDNKMHRYFPDFLVKVQTKSGKIETHLIEIKPRAEQLPPKTRNKKRLITETATYIVNQAKWTAAKKFCDEKGINFLVLNEKDLGIA